MSFQGLESLSKSKLTSLALEKEPVPRSEGKREADSRAAHEPSDDKYPPYGQNDSHCFLVREADTLRMKCTVYFLVW